MSKARSPRGVDSMTMGTRPDIVGSGRDGKVAWEGGGGGKGDQEAEEEKEDGDEDEVSRGRWRRLKELAADDDADDESDGIIDDALIDDASAAGKPLRAPAAAAAAARREASSTAPRLIGQFCFGERARRAATREGTRLRVQSNFFLF